VSEEGQKQTKKPTKKGSETDLGKETD